MDDHAVRTVSLELLRPGPAHNQLLSPLTRYLGICSDAAAGEVSVTYEHAELIDRLAQLHYVAERVSDPGARALGERQRRRALEDLSRAATSILRSVPGLSACMSKPGCEAESLIHLEIVVSAAELAMIPFEVSGPLDETGRDPGRFLSLSGTPPVTITRRLRSVSGACVRWPTRPRILFVAASPEKKVPYEEHRDVLLEAIQPWFNPHEADFMGELSRHLVVLNNATIEEVAAVCAQSKGSEPFTHVHVLAHGVPDPSAPGRSIGLALHDASNPKRVRVATGSSFASALQLHPSGSLPTVLTLAACDSGEVGDVLHTGASLLHEFHRAGVPLVIGSQFPLTFPGARVFVEALYPEILRGADPRKLLCELRLRLGSVLGGETHDWASLVAYAALPPDLHRQLVDVRYDRSRSALTVSLEKLRDFGEIVDSGDLPRDEASARWTQLTADIESAKQRLPLEPPYRTESMGLKASAKKRFAEVSFFRAMRNDGHERAALLAESVSQLEAARQGYDDAAEAEYLRASNEPSLAGSGHWVISQQLTLTAVLTGEVDDMRWCSAYLDAKTRSELGVGDAAAWGHCTLAELCLLKLAYADGTEEWAQRLRNHVARFSALAARDGFPLRSTMRELARYRDWWWSEVFLGLITAGAPRDTSVRPSQAAQSAVREALEILIQRQTAHASAR